VTFSKFPASARREAFEDDIVLAPPNEAMAQGRIAYDPEVGIEVSVVGADWFPKLGERSGGFWPVLHGESFTGIKFTLFDCGVRKLQEAAGRARAEMLAATLALGAQVDSPDEVAFKRMGLSLRGLREWLTGGFSQIEPTLKKGKENPNVRILNIDIGDADLQLVVEPRESGGRYRWVEETHASLNVTVPEPIPLSQWRTQWIDPLRHLMIFANREQSLIESLSGYPDPVDAFSLIRVFEQHETSVRQTSARSFYQRDLLPAGITGDTVELIRQWLDFHGRLGPAAGFLFGTLNSIGMTLENEFLNLMAFAEAYHRTLHDEQPLSRQQHASYRKAMLGALPDDPFIKCIYERDLAFSNRQSQRERMAWLVGRAALEGWPEGFEEEFVATAIETRNWLTHWGSKGKRVVEDGELARFNHRLLWVIHSNMLEDIGLEIEHVEKCLALGYVWDFPFEDTTLGSPQKP
jgi:ApeA N-terminal domain 1